MWAAAACLQLVLLRRRSEAFKELEIVVLGTGLWVGLTLSSRSHRAPVSEDVIALNKARSLMLILLATCNQTLLALDAITNVLDTDMTEDLRRMIARTDSELEVLTAKLATLR